MILKVCCPQAVSDLPALPQARNFCIFYSPPSCYEGADGWDLAAGKGQSITEVPCKYLQTYTSSVLKFVFSYTILLWIFNKSCGNHYIDDT